jgi:hypothetical protein
VKFAAAIALIVTMSAAAQGPEGLIARMRENAAAYSERLQNFLCTERMRRDTARLELTPRWQRLETQELEVTYENKRVRYRLTKVNGNAERPEERIKRGNYFTPGGEFGAMEWVFNSSARADFEFAREDSGAAERLCVFRYRIPLERTNAIFNINQQQVRAAHAGFVHVDCASAEIRRIEVETEPASAQFGENRVPIAIRLDIRYAKTRIADAEFLLPREAELTGRFNATLTRAQIQFEDYRKYEASTTITFEEPK